MEPIAENAVDKREEIKNKLRESFDGKIVRKDLTKKIKEGANVPVYVLEFLLGQYCSSDDEPIIEQGVQNVKRILADNFVRPDESQKVLSKLRKKGSYTVIDMITARLDRMNIRRSSTGCSAAVSGVLSSLTMSMWKKKRRMGCRYRSGS